MGLTSFKKDKVRRVDVTAAKNYLLEEEIQTLNRLTTMFLDYAQLQADAKAIERFEAFDESRKQSQAEPELETQIQSMQRTEQDILAQRRRLTRQQPES